MNNHTTPNFSQLLDTVFLISEEMIENKGEDSFFCAGRADAAIVSVFDGCGGLGSRTYPSFRNHSGAYIASRLLSGSTHDWFRDQRSAQWPDQEAFLASLKRYWNNAFHKAAPYTQSAPNTMKIRGSMVRDLPSTAALAFARPAAQGIDLHIVWAGDSRVYLLDQHGLAQLTRDDVDSDDAMTNLSDDGALLNVISADGQYTLNYKHMVLQEPAVILAATDGCFGYIPSPMEFEYTLLRTLAQAQTAEGFREQLRTQLHAVTGDDFALGWMSFGYGSFSNLKGSLRNRTAAVAETYAAPLLRGAGSETASRLWQQYRHGYERYL